MNQITHGAISSGIVDAGQCQCDNVTGRLKGPMFVRAINQTMRDHIWSNLEGQEAWPTRDGPMSVIKCHACGFGILDTSKRKSDKSPFNVAWEGNLALNLPQSVLDLD